MSNFDQKIQYYSFDDISITHQFYSLWPEFKDDAFKEKLEEALETGNYGQKLKVNSDLTMEQFHARMIDFYNVK
ncbi:hypothetical protein ACVRY7_01540 [Streptococcus ictaluri]|uniref:Uncharacterized protein n=1 Tax=Streptococcus ictaluri 707-05 TaxID=764299 RepID=G5JZH7_9STRE|nr:hypothetical protein [Streptococcus ictaluri]EHI70911.1 hypothetical protein STRIC_0688 [Streptococcus ictaluri 707-05]